MFYGAQRPRTAPKMAMMKFDKMRASFLSSMVLLPAFDGGRTSSSQVASTKAPSRLTPVLTFATPLCRILPVVNRHVLFIEKGRL